ncbi:SRPBCC family protein [Brevibacillus dissolubilis]|uniref:SRPBCC family protein n=1 Tax=Brevibacillus dissolubilis TaxID=1844116 RepID=UPI0021005067|nr:SRPBCC family protein [Brevibacillus dissolubilis]
MNNLTKMKIEKPAHEVFEAFVDPAKIKQFWFSSSSARWEQGKTVTLSYEEYHAQFDIEVAEVEPNHRIAFYWGEGEERHLVTITLEESDHASTIIVVNEEGFRDDDEDLLPKLIDNKEGWVYMLTCLKAYVEFGITTLRAGLVK